MGQGRGERRGRTETNHNHQRRQAVRHLFDSEGREGREGREVPVEKYHRICFFLAEGDAKQGRRSGTL